MKQEYNDEDEQTDYIWRHYSHLRTPLEGRGAASMFFRSQARNASSPRMKSLYFKKAAADDPELKELLKSGNPEFMRSVVKRMLEEHGEEIVVNRCPQCGCVVKTPTARQCLWCNHTWHIVNNSKGL